MAAEFRGQVTASDVLLAAFAAALVMAAASTAVGSPREHAAADEVVFADGYPWWLLDRTPAGWARALARHGVEPWWPPERCLPVLR